MTFDADHATRVRLAPSPPTEWRTHAACRGMSPSMFVVERGEDTSAAKAICATCPVTTECLDDAIATRDLGIRGGTSERDRRTRAQPGPTRSEKLTLEARKLAERGYHIDEIADRLGVTVRSAHRYLLAAERAAA